MLDSDIMHASKGVYYYLLDGVNANADLYEPMDCDPDNLAEARNQVIYTSGHRRIPVSVSTEVNYGFYFQHLGLNSIPIELLLY